MDIYRERQDNLSSVGARPFSSLAPSKAIMNRKEGRAKRTEKLLA